MRSLAVRAALLAAAAAAAVWLVADLRVARDVSRAEALTRSGRTPAAARLLRDARTRTASTQPDLRYAQLLAFAGRPREASRVLEGIVDAEPRNADAWAQLALARRDARDIGGYARARARYAELSPPR